MFKNGPKILHPISSGKLVFVLIILTGVVYSLMLFITIPEVHKYSNGLKILDLMPLGYQFEDVGLLFKNLGVEGRNAYLYYQLPVDFLFLLLYSTCFCAVFCYLIKKLGKQNSRLIYISLLPLVLGLSDLAENTGILILLRRYPEIHKTTVFISNTFSILKSVTMVFTFLALLFVLISVFVSFFLKKQKTGNKG
jgi:flagellar biogenesis protein FliO